MSEQIKKIIGEELYSQVVEKGLKPTDFDITKGWIPKQRFDEVNSKLKLTEEKVTSFETKNEEVKTLLNSHEELKKGYFDLEAKYKDDLSKKDKEILNTKKKFLIESELSKSGAKYTDLLISKVDFDSITDFEKDIPTVIEKLRSSYEEMFIKKVSSSSSSSGPNKTNKEEIWEDKLMKIFKLK